MTASKVCISPGVFGAHFGGSGNWELCIHGDHLVARRSGAAHTRRPLASIHDVRLVAGLVWSTIEVVPAISDVPFSGITKFEGRKFVTYLRDCIAASLARKLVNLNLVVNEVAESVADLVAGKRFIAGHDLRELREQLVESMNQDVRTVLDAIRSPLLRPGLLPANTQRLVSELRDVFEQKSDLIDAANRSFVEAELGRYKLYFDTVEKVPLSDEQRRACIVMEDRNLLVAAAGSGKTAAIVGKVGYLLHAGICRPDEILVLAFNNRAAKEIEHRLKSRLSLLISEGATPRVATFHSFGRHVLASVDGGGPAIANHEEGGATTAAAHIDRLITRLCEDDGAFFVDWLHFQIMYPTTAADPFDAKKFPELKDWEEYCRKQGTFRDGKVGLLTLKGDIVKSHGELAIANWLYMNGIPYEYERAYEYDTQSAGFKQYRPDFYLPDIKAYLEHFATGRDGRVPDIFEAGPNPYSHSMRWKREQHQRRQTTLLETTFGDFLEGTLFEKLEAMLVARGQKFSPLPPADLLRQVNSLAGTQIGSLIRAFIRHMKSNRFPIEELKRKCRASPQPGRALHFLRIVQRVSEAYEADLHRTKTIDFDDMIAKATSYLEAKRCWHSYKIVLVDEFQDISMGRARMLQALLREPKSTKLFAVGDDWQSIYRFAGSDIDLFTRFHEHFGRTAEMQLTKTFRSNQAISDTASAFVMRNQAQRRKSIKSHDSRRAPAISIVTYDRRRTDQQALTSALREIASIVKRGPQNGRASIAILARYNRSIESIDGETLAEFRRHMSIETSTIHRAKGTEADYVVVLGLERGRFGFPAEMEDDPLLGLAMPRPEAYPLAEERRLFYVALTRARHGVYLVANRAFPSAFAQEILNDFGNALAPFPRDGHQDAPSDTLCKKCRSGVSPERSGRAGKFTKCSNFPLCNG